ncbi:type II secretion system F family protein [Nocardiopsis sp. CNT-189]|uniref:type II secretion system F family protein n=1 Tax=Nocardiopsis oceanisediminis TaxID=2816862 RepID=UPI003B3377FC
MLLLIAVAVLGGAAVRLLLFPGTSVGRLRLAAAVPGRTAVRSRPGARHGRTARRAAAGAVLCAPAAALWAVAGVGPAVLLGAPAGAALWWGLRRTAGAGERERAARITAELPLALDLLAAGVRAGGAPVEVLSVLSAALDGPLGRVLGEIAERQRLGADPAEAWAAGGAPAPAAVGRALARAAETGSPLADLLERQAAEARSEAHGRALERARRTAVLVVAPLGLCFLPAFVLIGVVPLVAGLLGGLAPP